MYTLSLTDGEFASVMSAAMDSAIEVEKHLKEAEEKNDEADIIFYTSWNDGLKSAIDKMNKLMADEKHFENDTKDAPSL